MADARRAKRRWDLIVLDPPSFSTVGGTGNLDIQRDHRALIEETLGVLTPEGTLYFSTNHQRFEPRLERLGGVRAEELTTETVPEDYRDRPHRPVAFDREARVPFRRLTMTEFITLFADPQTWIALIALASLEIVLGIDNIVFIAILTSKLPESQQPLAYRIGLLGAMGTRIALLLAISWIMGLTEPLFSVLSQSFTGRDLILLIGGLFLIGKSAHEIYEKVELLEHGGEAGAKGGLGSVVVQIMLMDIIFSLDSVITAVGMVEEVAIMIIAVIIAIGVMLVFAKSIGDFVNRHPSMKLLALSFLLLIGVLLTAEGLGQHVNKGYIYFAMSFALIVELLNMRFRKRRKRTAKPA